MSTKLASKSLSTLALIVLALLGLSTGNEFSEMPYKPDILDTDWHWESPDDTDHLQSRGGDAVEDEEPFFSFGMIICKCFRFYVCTPLSDSPVTFYFRYPPRSVHHHCRHHCGQTHRSTAHQKRP